MMILSLSSLYDYKVLAVLVYQNKYLCPDVLVDVSRAEMRCLLVSERNPELIACQ